MVAGVKEGTQKPVTFTVSVNDRSLLSIGYTRRGTCAQAPGLPGNLLRKISQLKKSDRVVGLERTRFQPMIKM